MCVTTVTYKSPSLVVPRAALFLRDARDRYPRCKCKRQRRWLRKAQAPTPGATRRGEAEAAAGERFHSANCHDPRELRMQPAAWNLGAQRRDRKAWGVLRERLEADAAELRLTLVEVEEMLRQLLEVALPNPRIRGEEIAAVVTALARVLPLSSGLLCSEFARFVQKACAKERVLFAADQLELVMEFFLNFIKVCPAWYTASSIRALGMILHDNADRATHELDLLFAVLLKHLDPAGVDIEARYAATSCVSNICTQAGKTPEIYPYFASLLRMVVENFRQQSQSLTRGDNERILVRACTCSMKCIYTIINSNHEQLNDRISASLPGLLSSMRQVVGYGLTLQHQKDRLVFAYQDELPVSDSDSSVCGSDSSSVDGRGTGEYVQPHLLRFSEVTKVLRPLLYALHLNYRGLLARLRITVLNTFEVIVRFFPKSITSSVGLYLPEQTTPYMTLYGDMPSVLTLLIADPCEKARISAVKFLDGIWEKIPLKQYFRHSVASSAEATTTSFASMPKRISLMLYQVHFALVYSIQHEREGGSLIQMLKTTASVVQRFPYPNVGSIAAQSRLSPSLDELTNALASCLYNVATTTDHSVRMASLSCLSALLNIQDALPAMLEWMISTTSAIRIFDGASVSISCGSNLLRTHSFVEELLQIAAHPDESGRALLRLEAMSLLSKIAKNYSAALSVNWARLSAFMLAAFQDMDPNVRLQAVKILENYIKGEGTRQTSVQSAVSYVAATNHHQADGVGDMVHPSESRNACLTFLATHLVRAFHDTSHHVRACVCACFTLLSSSDWDELLEIRLNLPVYLRGSAGKTTADSYAALFLQTPHDTSPVVRAAGFRLLGSLCLTPAFKKREFSCLVAGLSLDALGDSTLNVRVRAAWALGNVCTTIGPESVPLMERQNGSIDKPLLLYDLLPPVQMRHITEKMLVCINDNDKVASSVARTLGLICRWISFEPFVATLTPYEAAGLHDLLSQAMVILASKINTGSPKVRWNACHAIAKVLLCPSLPLASVTWAPAVFQALITAISQQENFKVRISACTALRVSRSRSAYGNFFKSSLYAIIDALETASDLKDVTEFRYKEQLETQLSFTLVHLIQIATEEDDALIWTAIRSKPAEFLYDWLLHNLHRMSTAIEMEASREDGGGLGGDENDESGATGGGAGGSGDAHDINPIKKEELLTAVRSLLRILQRMDTANTYTTSCSSLLYDTKLALEREVLFSREDIAFEF